MTQPSDSDSRSDSAAPTESDASGTRGPPRVLFPLLVIAPGLVTAALVSLAVPPPLAMTATVLGLIAVVTLLERRMPFRRDWNHPARPELVTDFAYIALASGPDRLARLAVEGGAIAVVALVGGSAAIGS